MDTVVPKNLAVGARVDSPVYHNYIRTRHSHDIRYNVITYKWNETRYYIIIITIIVITVLPLIQ